MAKGSGPSQATSLTLSKCIEAEVVGWRNQGYSGGDISETTRLLLQHWFDRDEDADAGFHACQRLAIETVIYLQECRKIGSLRQLYEDFEPEKLKLFKTVADEVNSTPFLKYCIKSATGSGKTWVLAALVVWQYFNTINGETTAPYSARFIVVTPGVEVRNRIFDSFLGRNDPKTGSRLPETSDYRRPLFIPDSLEWRGRFALLDNVLKPDDIRANADRCFIIETKADRDLALPTVAIKARAARSWCEQISGIEPPPALPQPLDWEYLILSESVYAANQGIAFDALLPMMRQTRDGVIASGKGELFA